jgi:hypothetical protein
MTTTLRWIGSLPSVLQASLDRAVSAELHSIASDICQSKLTARLAANGSAQVSGCDFVKSAASDINSTAPEKIAA